MDGINKFTFNATLLWVKLCVNIKEYDNYCKLCDEPYSAPIRQDLEKFKYTPRHFLLSCPYLSRYPQILRWYHLHIDVYVPKSVKTPSRNNCSIDGYNLYIIGQRLCRIWCEILSIWTMSVAMMIENSLSNPIIFIYESVGRCQSTWSNASKRHADTLMLKWFNISVLLSVQESYALSTLNEMATCQMKAF